MRRRPLVIALLVMVVGCGMEGSDVTRQVTGNRQAAAIDKRAAARLIDAQLAPR